MAVNASTALVDGATYEFGYYKVTGAGGTNLLAASTASAAITSTGADLKFKIDVEIDAAAMGEYIADTTNAWFVKKNATLTVSIENATLGATGTGVGSVTITADNATANKTGGTDNKITVADSDAIGSKQLTITFTAFTDDTVITFTGAAT